LKPLNKIANRKVRHSICLTFVISLILRKGEALMKIIIGSKNQAKVMAVQQTFLSHHVFIALDVPSGVRSMPFSDEETIKGAINRAENAVKIGKGDIGIGLEGGVEETPYGLFLCNWGALSVLGHSTIIAGGARILLPADVAERLRKGEELGPLIDEYTKKQNIRQKEGAVGIFTNNQINRVEMFTHVMKLLVGQYEYYSSHKK
jgi:inosine/xanthosine triphosphatase